jgi:trehalose utilization protein
VFLFVTGHQGGNHLFYFRLGRETFPVYKEKPVLQLLENAVRWLAPAAG